MKNNLDLLFVFIFLFKEFKFSLNFLGANQDYLNVSIDSIKELYSTFDFDGNGIISIKG